MFVPGTLLADHYRIAWRAIAMFVFTVRMLGSATRKGCHNVHVDLHFFRPACRLVNSVNNLENLKAPDDTWKVRLIEEDFHQLMFEIEGV